MHHIVNHDYFLSFVFCFFDFCFMGLIIVLHRNLSKWKNIDHQFYSKLAARVRKHLSIWSKIGNLSVPFFFSPLEKLALEPLSFCSYLGWLRSKPAHTHTLELELAPPGNSHCLSLCVGYPVSCFFPWFILLIYWSTSSCSFLRKVSFSSLCKSENIFILFLTLYW